MQTPIKDPLNADLEQALDLPAHTEVRWALCLAVDKFGETGCHLEDLWLVAESMQCGLNRNEVEAMVKDLCQRDWFDYHEAEQEGDQDYVTPTNQLPALVNFEVDCPVDIGRPSSKYWED